MSERTAAQPPAGPHCPPLMWERTYPGHPSQATQMRTALRALLTGCPTAEDAILLASELATNAITHSASGQPGGTFTIRAHIHDGAIHGQIEDQGSAWNGQISAGRSPHGLYLVRRLSAACGTRRGQHGWITWYTIGLAATNPAPQ